MNNGRPNYYAPPGPQPLSPGYEMNGYYDQPAQPQHQQQRYPPQYDPAPYEEDPRTQPNYNRNFNPERPYEDHNRVQQRESPPQNGGRYAEVLGTEATFRLGQRNAERMGRLDNPRLPEDLQNEGFEVYDEQASQERHHNEEAEYRREEYNGVDMGYRQPPLQTDWSDEEYEEPRDRYYEDKPVEYMIPRPTYYGPQKQFTPRYNDPRQNPHPKEPYWQGEAPRGRDLAPRRNPVTRTASATRRDDRRQQPNHVRKQYDYGQRGGARNDRHPGDKYPSRYMSPERYNFSQMNEALPKPDYDRQQRQPEPPSRMTPPESRYPPPSYNPKNKRRDERYHEPQGSRQRYKNEGRAKNYDDYYNRDRYYDQHDSYEDSDKKYYRY